MPNDKINIRIDPETGEVITGEDTEVEELIQKTGGPLEQAGIKPVEPADTREEKKGVTPEPEFTTFTGQIDQPPKATQAIRDKYGEKWVDQMEMGLSRDWIEANVNPETGEMYSLEKRREGIGDRSIIGPEEAEDKLEELREETEKISEQVSELGEEEEKKKEVEEEEEEEEEEEDGVPDVETDVSYQDWVDEQYKKGVDAIDKDMDKANDILDSAQETMDDNSKALIQNIKNRFDVARGQQKEVNKALLQSTKLLGARSGRQRYAPQLQTDILSERASKNIQNLNALDVKENQLLLEAKMADDENDYKIAVEKLDQYMATQDAKRDLLIDLQKEARKMQENAEERAQQAFENQMKWADHIRKEKEFMREEQVDRAETIAPLVKADIDAMGLSVHSPDSLDYVESIAAAEGIDYNTLMATILKQEETEYDYEITNDGRVMFVPKDIKGDPPAGMSRSEWLNSQVIMGRQVETPSGVAGFTDEDIRDLKTWGIDPEKDPKAARVALDGTDFQQKRMVSEKMENIMELMEDTGGVTRDTLVAETQRYAPSLDEEDIYSMSFEVMPATDQELEQWEEQDAQWAAVQEKAGVDKSEIIATLMGTGDDEVSGGWTREEAKRIYKRGKDLATSGLWEKIGIREQD